MYTATDVVASMLNTDYWLMANADIQLRLRHPLPLHQLPPLQLTAPLASTVAKQEFAARSHQVQAPTVEQSPVQKLDAIRTRTALAHHARNILIRLTS
jgi:hypothetical protein